MGDPKQLTPALDLGKIFHMMVATGRVLNEHEFSDAEAVAFAQSFLMSAYRDIAGRDFERVKRSLELFHTSLGRAAACATEAELTALIDERSQQDQFRYGFAPEVG